MSAQIKITLPDGAVREYATGTTGAEVAADISKSLAKSALACRIDGKLSDLSIPLEKDAELAIVTARDEREALELHQLGDQFGAAGQVDLFQQGLLGTDIEGRDLGDGVDEGLIV